MPTVNYTPTATSPDPLDLASMAGTGASPGVLALTGMAPTATSPSAKALADMTPSVAAPEGLALAGMNPTAAAPSTKALAATAPTDDAPQQVASVASAPTPTNANMITPALIQTGKLVVGTTFGFYEAPAPAVVTGVQLTVQTVPVGADVIIELVDTDGNSLGVTATLPAGESYKTVNFGTPVALLTGAKVRAKVTQVGSTTAGSYLTANLLVQLT